MTLSFNLATHPFENRRRFYVLALGSGVLLVAATGLLLGLSVRNYSRGRVLSREMTGLRAEMSQLEGQQKALEEKLHRPEVMDLMDRSQFFNSLIRRKAISWTRIFMDLETLMPERVQVVSVHPVVREATKANPEGNPRSVEMNLQMIVSSENMTGLLELLRRVERSDKFHQPVLRLETPPGGGIEKLYQLQMDVLYAQK